MSLAFYLTVGSFTLLLLAIAAFVGIQGLRTVAQQEDSKSH